MPTENQIILNVLNGNTNAFSEIMNKYHDEIYRYVFNILGDANYSDDVVQEIFIRVFNKLKSFDSKKAGFRTWLYRVSHNYTVNYLKTWNKKRKMETLTEHNEKITSKENIEEKIVEEEKVETILIAIEKVLKQKAKNVIYLHYFSDLSPKEISEITGIPVQTIYKSIEASLEKIRNEVTLNGNNE